MGKFVLVWLVKWPLKIRLVGAISEDANMFQNILFIVATGISVWFLVRMFPRRDISRVNAHKVPANPFLAVSLHYSPAACQAIKAKKGKRFLPSEAPRLPLEGCTAKECHCIYHHHVDRRTSNGDRRGIGSDRFLLLSNGDGNRRVSAGRRAIDKPGDLSWT